MEISNKNQQTLKRVRPQKYLDIDRYFLELFEHARFNDLIVFDEILKAMTLFFGTQLGLEGFKANGTWATDFKKRYGIKSVSI